MFAAAASFFIIHRCWCFSLIIISVIRPAIHLEFNYFRDTCISGRPCGCVCVCVLRATTREQRTQKQANGARIIIIDCNGNFGLKSLTHLLVLCVTVDRQNNHVLTALIMDHPSFDSHFFFVLSSSVLFSYLVFVIRSSHIIMCVCVSLHACLCMKFICESKLWMRAFRFDTFHQSFNTFYMCINSSSSSHSSNSSSSMSATSTSTVKKYEHCRDKTRNQFQWRKIRPVRWASI